jgi:ABC-type proline/glycine betaine transport system permease subunit
MAEHGRYDMHEEKVILSILHFILLFIVGFCIGQWTTMPQTIVLVGLVVTISILAQAIGREAERERRA